MAIKSYTEQLEEVQTAISKIISGAQAYSVGGRNFTYADLAVLQEREKYLRVMVDRETNSDGYIEPRYGVIG